MANESKPSRTQVEDLQISETELTTEEARKVQGGKAANDRPKLGEADKLTATAQTRTGPSGYPKKDFAD